MAILPVLSIARDALRANETALAVTASNVANASRPGYTRQVVELAANALGGVHVAAITRVLDPLLLRRLLAAGTERQEQDARREQLAALGGVLSELETPSLGSALAGFFDAAAALERNPEGLAERQTLLSRAAALAAELNRRSAAVASLQRAGDERYVAEAARADDDLRRIAELNRAIVAAEAGGSPASALRDQRQQALTDLAGRVGVSVVEDEHGAVSVRTLNGAALVTDADVVRRIVVRESGIGLDGRPLHEAGLAGADGAFLSVPEAFARGELAGRADARDGGLARAAGGLDTLARAVLEGVNAIQTDAAARDLNGNPTADAPLFAGSGAGDLRVVLDDPARIAAALSSERGDNRNASRLAALRTSALPLLGGVGFTAYLAARQAEVGEDAARTTDAAAASTALLQQLENQRAALSGVDLNEEMANMLAYQRAFQAATRVVQVADAMLADLLEVVG